MVWVTARRPTALSEIVVAALDAGELELMSAALVGLRVLAVEMLRRARAYREAFVANAENTIETVFGDLDASLSVARGPRAARQARLGAALLA